MTKTEQEEVIIDPDEFDETIEMVCPQCGLTGDVPAEWEGLEIECKDCDQRFTVSDSDDE